MLFIPRTPIMPHALTLVTLLAVLLCLSVSPARGGSLHAIKLTDIDGNDTTLGAYQGKVVLVVNVASKCGFTKQYKGLEEMYRKYSDQGLVVLGFPCNQFGGQEPGTGREIKAFCTDTYEVTFPLFDKIEVNGNAQHPLYRELTGDASPFPGRIKWNFTKFLIGRDGTILNRFGSTTPPDSKELINAVETALAEH
jgi:glutathione peroxidase